jgi:hypothetical protein
MKTKFEIIQDGKNRARSTYEDRTVVIGIIDQRNELLAACKAALSRDFDCCDDESSNKTHEIRAQIRAAIAKAEGRKP